MLSSQNLAALDAAGLKFIVGARQTKAPHDLESHYRWHGDFFEDGQVIDTVTPRHANSCVNDTAKKTEPVWDETMGSSWRAVWQYSRRRAVRDQKTLNLQRAHALSVVEGGKRTRKPRFVRQSTKGAIFDAKAFARAEAVVGLKGYVTNIPASLMPSGEVIASYHDLWHVEQSFRMSKTDLRARPIFHHQKEAIEAHLTVVIAALAVSRYLYQKTGITTKKLVKLL
ncbi:MAG: transposase [Mobiluncus sp.]|uniref:IS1634 family transposase n=1 Tax=Mobiluncus sp. TaxID=47293 RepID=UPI00259006D8|nr:transposase [Mobiluncus sp.]MCI6583488.1 transposase [Mobiluncus sp.]